MMTLAGVVAHRFLEGYILFAPKKKETTYRRIDIGPMKNGALGDSQAALKGNRICRGPTGRQHRPDQIVLVADKGKIQWITMYAGAGCRNSRTIDDCLMPGKHFPAHRDHQISSEQPDHQEPTD